MKVYELNPYTGLGLQTFSTVKIDEDNENSLVNFDVSCQTKNVIRNSQCISQKNYSIQNPFPYDKRSLQQIKGGIIKISTLVQSKNLSFECFISAATLYYSYITTSYITSDQISPVAITCVYVASKITEVTQLTPSDLKDLTNDNHKILEIIQIQGKIISSLNFNIFTQTPISNILWDESMLDDERKDKLCFLIQISLMSGYQILNDSQNIREVVQFVKNQENGSKLGKKLIPILRNYQVKMTTFKYSLKFDVDSFTQKFYE